MKIIILPALLCISICAGAQIHWAAKAGIQTSTASYKTADASISTGNVTGFSAGVLAKVYFDDKVAFVSGVQYSAKGFSVKQLAADVEKTYKLNYLDIPVMFQFDLFKARGKGLYVKAGPTISVGLNGHETYTGTDGLKVQNKALLSLSGNHFGLFDASMNAALGFSFTQKFFAEAAYAYGIGNINNDWNGANIKTRVLSVSVGYFLR